MKRRRHRQITLTLTRRADGMWCKSIDGAMSYFGTAGCEEQEARIELIEFIRNRERGSVRISRPENLTVNSLASQYADVCEGRVKDGSLQDRTWKEYDLAIQRFVKGVGPGLLVEALGADAFATVARQWRRVRGVNRVNNDIQAIRGMFRWAYENGLIDRQPIYGSEFAKAAANEARNAAAVKTAEHGLRKFTAAELKTILANVTGPMKPMVLLALNAGLYSVDISDLLWSDLKREKSLAIIDTLRHKTGIPRRFVLWPETLKAIDAMPRKADRMFLTNLGNPWNQRNGTDSISMLFRRLLERLGIKRKGVGFGSFRHTHVSAVGDHPDQSAARLVRGHQIEGIVRHYDFPSTARIKSVTDLARRRLIRTEASRVRKSASAA